MTPMTGRIADRNKKRAVFFKRLSKNVFFKRKPGNRLMSVLTEIETFLMR